MFIPQRPTPVPAPLPPLPLTARERVLRLAAYHLPAGVYSPRTTTLERIARELRALRGYYVHEPETLETINAWLEVYGVAS